MQVVLKRLSKMVGDPKVASELQMLSDAVTRVDMAAARARYSARMSAAPVKFSKIDEDGLQAENSLGGGMHATSPFFNTTTSHTTSLAKQPATHRSS